MAAAGTDNHVELSSIGKSYGGVEALSEINLTIRRGSIHALVGENGAGKSTLGKIIGGVLQQDAGELRVDGRAVRYGSPRDAIRDGIALVEQELALSPPRSVSENVFLGHEPTRFGFVRKAAIRKRFDQLNEESGFGLDPDAPVESLRLADRQKVEILRALSRDAHLIVMDEPTAGLALDEIQRLCQMVQRLRDRGTTVVYVSHALEEVLAIADTITVLRNGREVWTRPAKTQSTQSLIHAMLGEEVDLAFRQKPKASDADVRLSISGLQREGVLNPVDLEVRKGEIVGIAGLIGSGRSELIHILFGAMPHDGGTVCVNGEPVQISRPSHAIAAGLALLPESRKEQGLLVERNVRENISLMCLPSLTKAGFVGHRAERQLAESMVERLDIRTPSVDTPVRSLSGGNQQKVLFAKCLATRPDVLIVDEPTRGVDVGAKFAIYELIWALAAEGTAVLFVSSEVEEVLGLAQRILVMRGRSIVAEFGADTATQQSLMTAAFGTAAE